MPSHREDVPLRQSMLWSLNERYYQEQGLEAWRSGVVPYFPTSNNLIAESYARVIAAWARDIGETVHIVELGAGHGRFSYLCARTLLRLGAPFRYTMTDVASRNIASWQENTFLQPMLRLGLLRSRKLNASREALSIDGPTVIIANYIFDSLRTDVFQVTDGALQEGRPTLSSAQHSLRDTRALTDLKVEFRYTSVQAEDYYGDPVLDRVLAETPRRLPSTTFPFPIGALRLLRHSLRQPSPLMLLSLDKGYTRLDELRGLSRIGLGQHGSISLMVNYDAIRRLFELLGGQAHLHTPHGGTLEGGMFLAGGGPCPAAQQAFRAHLGENHPFDFQQLYQAVHRTPEHSLHLMLSMLRTSRYDSRVFNQLFPALYRQAKSSTPPMQVAIAAVLDRVHESTFQLAPLPDTAGSLGRLYYRIRRYPRSLECYEAAIERRGETATTRYNMGLCLQMMGRLEAATHEMQHALSLDAAYTDAQRWLAQFGTGGTDDT